MLILLIAFMPFAANAEWVAGAGFYNLSDDEGGVDISLNAVTGSIGYRIENDNSNFSFMPELRAGIGIGDDTVFGVDVELDRVLVFSLRGQFDFENGAYFFAAPAYANIEVKASAAGFSVSEDDSQAGIGAGVGFRFNERNFAEVSYETYDGTDVIGIAWKISLR